MNPLTLNRSSLKRKMSFTQLSTFLACPRKYEFQYLQRLKRLPSGAMIQSRVWHETLEYNYLQKIQSDIDLSLTEMTDFFVNRFEEVLLQEEVGLHPWEKEGKLKDQGVAIVAAHHKSIAPAIHPLFVEYAFEVDLGKEIPFTLVGVFDLVERDGTIVDHKAYRKAPSQDKLDKDLQFTAYALAYFLKWQEMPQRLRMDAVIKYSNPKALQLVTHRTQEQCQWFLGLVQKVGRAIQEEHFFPNPTHPFCSAEWCSYWEPCMNLKEGENT